MPRTVDSKIARTFIAVPRLLIPNVRGNILGSRPVEFRKWRPRAFHLAVYNQGKPAIPTHEVLGGRTTVSPDSISNE